MPEAGLPKSLSRVRTARERLCGLGTRVGCPARLGGGDLPRTRVHPRKDDARVGLGLA